MTREKLEAMNCGVPEADKDPFADDEPVEVSTGQFDADGNDVRRIPPGLVCSDQDRIVGGKPYPMTGALLIARSFRDRKDRPLNPGDRQEP